MIKPGHLVKDLNKSYSEAAWEKIKMLNYTLSCNVGLQENRFKILNRWYLALSRTYLQIPDNCWRCNREAVGFLHVWLEPLWRRVNAIIREIMGYDLGFNPGEMLLFDFSIQSNCK